ncbi:uncharacterized protein LOC131316770 isoform X2 [Rhododendron vialii]|uniref:uncharacterized protein LOC131316770 isoform X2 n=1 Tax=Rhododendron vialii TaxID=182163 RepID=UPI00265E0CC7|nr:uncharacterized protein LOC131316770 isoform X2 [Rhododendron vialii]
MVCRHLWEAEENSEEAEKQGPKNLIVGNEIVSSFFLTTFVLVLPSWLQVMLNKRKGSGVKDMQVFAVHKRDLPGAFVLHVAVIYVFLLLMVLSCNAHVQLSLCYVSIWS